MKSRLRPLLSLGLALIPFAPLSAALDTRIVSSDAQWVMHLDLNSLRESAIGREILKQIETAPLNTKLGPLQLNVPKLLQTIGSVTSYGTNLSQDPRLVDGALILQGAPELRKIAEGLVAQATITTPEALTELKDLPFEAYSVQGELLIAFPPEPVILVSKSKAQLLNARAVFLGQAKSLAGTAESPLRNLIREDAGSFVLAASVVPSEKFFPDDAPQARILQMAKSASLELGEADGQTFAYVQLLASSDEMADKLMKILQGITAMISLAETSDKALADFLQSVTVARNKNTVTLHLAYASDRLVQMVQELQQAQQNSTQTIGAGARRKGEVSNEPKPPVEEKLVAQWTADQDLGDLGVSPKTLVSQTIPNVALAPGAIIVLTGHRNAGENARFDYVEITPASGGLARRFEAEDMQRENYFELENRHASGGKLIESLNSYGTARFPFDGPAGAYTLTVRYVDENDGKSSFFVSVKDPQPTQPEGMPVHQ